MKNLNLNTFCEKYCDKMYTPNVPYEDQCTGYKMLRKMVEEQITPATKEECIRWENNPTEEELLEVPKMKYMRFLHVNLREHVQNNWERIKKLEL